MRMNSEDSDPSKAVETNTKSLDALIKAFKNPPKARVGVLGDTNARKGASKNAEIGAKHEFGDDKLPVRSFSRMPLTTEFKNFLEKTNFFTEQLLKEVIVEGDLEGWIAKLGIVGVQTINEAFATGGFGKWKPSDMRFKKNHETLVETQQLRNSITSDVK